MKLYKLKQGVLVEVDGKHYRLDVTDWNALINDDHIIRTLEGRIKNQTPTGDWQNLLASQIDAPMQDQELWASGVTYERSRQGRQEESKKAGGADFYAHVYAAERPRNQGQRRTVRPYRANEDARSALLRAGPPVGQSALASPILHDVDGPCPARSHVPIRVRRPRFV